MAASGPISGYFVDSLIAADGDSSSELLAPRFAGHGGASARPGALLPDCSDFPSCSFAPKPAVFATSWAPVAPQGSLGYPHPHAAGPYAPGAAEAPRYVRGWLEPLGSFPPFAARPFAIKDALGPRRGECAAAEGRAFAELVYANPERAAGAGAATAEAELVASGKHKEQRHEVEPRQPGFASKADF
ncbi:PREDICTED: homeobox protein Hox-C9-like [Sturnus vulgaris]|uniref:homeobox protein Hox-C9-like n=1 Tax=Sturnus vulgaris TaxID=9172 RepID=UPI00071A2C30|nr:PREDICTED: homeobox protein Hox-C9-like [Sturnus vulgaris]